MRVLLGNLKDMVEAERAAKTGKKPKKKKAKGGKKKGGAAKKEKAGKKKKDPTARYPACCNICLNCRLPARRACLV